MRVLQRGQAPQRKFQLQPLVGSVQRVGIRSESSTSIRDAGKTTQAPPMPGVQLILSAEVTRVSQGEVTYRFTLEQVDLLVQGGTPAKAVEALRAELAPLPGLTGEGHVGATGQSGAFSLKLPGELSPELRGQMEEMAAMLKGLGTFLPSEPVGAGARWEQGGLGGKLAGGSTRVELKSVEADVLGLRIELDTPRTPQPVPPGLRTQYGGETLHTESRGQGACLISLDRLWPTRFELDVETHAEARAGDDKAPRRMEANTTLRTRLKELAFTPPRVRANPGSHI
jgi:hypothetical protein